LRFIELQLKGYVSPTTELVFHYASDAVIYICSALNNLLFLAAARILLNKNKMGQKIRPLKDDDRVFVQPGQKLINAFTEFRGAIPAWAWVCAAMAPLALLDSMPKFLWARFPDAIFSVYCLTWFGYAIAINLNVRRRAVLAGIAMVITLVYGAGQVVYAANPIIAYAAPPNRSSTFPLPWIRAHIGIKVDELTVATNKQTGKTDTPKKFLDGAVYAMLLPMKLALFLPAFFLYLLFFIVSFNDIRPALFESISRRKDYLSGDGIVSAIGNGLGAERVLLFIRIPGMQELSTGQEERALPLVWDVANPDLSKRPAEPISISDNPFLLKIMKEEGEEILAHHENGQGVKTTVGAGGRGPWLVPIRFHGGVIGALQSDLVGNRKNHTTLQKLRLMADLVAPSVQDYRSLAAVDQIGFRFTRLQVDYPKDTFAEATERMVGVLHDVLSPLATRLVIEIGFLSIQHIYSESSEYTEILEAQEINYGMKGEETQFVGADKSIRLEVSPMLVRTAESYPEGAAPEPLPLGSLMLAIPAEKDEFSRPTLAAYYLNRKAVASLTTDGLFDIARDSLGGIIKDLGVELTEETLSHEYWFKAIMRAIHRAGLLWVVASDGNGEEFQGERQSVEIVTHLSEEEKATILAKPLSSIIPNPPNLPARHVIRLHLPKSRYQLWLGVARSAFGHELNFESPWRVFLHDLVNVTDTALDSMQKRQEAEVEKLRAAQNQGVMTIAVTTGTLMHQLLNMIKDQLFATESLEEESKEPDVKMNAKCQNLLRTMRQSVAQMRELTEAFKSVTKMEGPRPCSIKEAAEQATKLFKVSLTQRKIEVKINQSAAIQVDVPFYVAAFAIANLIGNAKDAIWSNGQIEIEGEDDGKFVLCHVTNSGPEIPKDVQETLFQFGKSGKTGHNGWGLYFVEKSINENGGSIRLAYSNTTGTRFTIRLPKQRLA
jgi:signal transduction histidine kinase